MDHLRAASGCAATPRSIPRWSTSARACGPSSRCGTRVGERVTDLVFRVEQLDEGFVGSTWTEAEADPRGRLRRRRHRPAAAGGHRRHADRPQAAADPQPPAARGPQRSLPLRQRQEVQELPHAEVRGKRCRNRESTLKRQFRAAIAVVAPTWNRSLERTGLSIGGISNGRPTNYLRVQQSLMRLGRWDSPATVCALSLLRDVPLLPTDPPVGEIVQTYMRHSVMPADPSGDALHLAIASYYRCEFLLTWNCKHLANANKFRHIQRINTLLGLYVPALVTPLELVDEEA